MALSLVSSMKAQAQNQSAATGAQGNAASPAAQTLPAPVPKDPKALMVLAAKVNGLAGLNDHPWHLKANYQTFDADGRPELSGVYEEWRANSDKFKVVYTSPTFHSTEYGDGQNRAMEGDSTGRPLQLSMATRYLLNPLPSPALFDKYTYDAYERKAGRVRLQCVRPNEIFPGSAVPTACFNEELAVMRVETLPSGLMVLFNWIVEAAGHYIAKQVVVEDGGIPIVELNVTTLEFPRVIPAVELAIPAGAMRSPVVALSARVTAGRRISGDEVSYPPMARGARIQGLVILEAMIDKKGSIANLVVLAGPPMLRAAAVDAVKTWKYQPYLLNGKPVEVQTQINVTFRLDR